MVFLLYGEDGYRAKMALAATRERFQRTRDASGMNCLVLSADSASFQDVREALLTPPFLAEKKMVIVAGFLQEKKEIHSDLYAVVEKLSDDIVAVFYEPVALSALTESPLLSFLREQPYSSHFPSMSAGQAQHFFAEQVMRCGVQLSQDLRAQMIREYGVESWFLASEAHKLAMYVRGQGREEIQREDFEVLACADQIDEKLVFDFTDTYVRGQVQRSLVLFRALLDQGSHPLQLSTILLKQMRTIVAVRDLLDRDIDPKTRVKIFGVHPFVLMKATKIAERTSKNVALACLERLLIFDSALKSSIAEPEDALCASMVPVL